MPFSTAQRRASSAKALISPSSLKCSSLLVAAGLHFSDEGEISAFALEALRWAVENGILNGYDNGRLGPQGQATRAQAAQMLKNFIENQEGSAIR